MNILKNENKYFRLTLGLVLLITIYFLLLYYEPGINEIPHYQKRDATAIFYTDIENIEHLIK